MIFKTFDNSDVNINEINNFIEDDKDIFILVFMHGCGPCNNTRPEWNKIKNLLIKKYKNNNNIVIVDVNKEYLPKLKYIGDVDGFPAIKYISNYGKNIETYEESNIKNKDRSANSFVNWIESNINKKKTIQNGAGSVFDVINRLLNQSNKKKSQKKKKNYKKAKRKSKKILK
jgi:UDP-N-acetylglucosamine 2-epimerase